MASRGKTKSAPLRQSSLFQLRGVVVLEQLQDEHARLKDPDVPDEAKVGILKTWSGKQPSTKVITETGVGKTVRRLAKDPKASEAVRAAAGRVYAAWRRQVERREDLSARGPLQVASDLGTQRFRGKSRRMLAEAAYADEDAAFAKSDPYAKRIDEIERAVFEASRRLLDTSYRRRVRKLVQKLRHRTELRRSVFGDENGGISVRQLLEEHAS